MAADRDHDVIEAIARDLREWGCREPEAAAREIVVAVRGFGYRPRIEPPDDGRHGGGASPETVSDALSAIKSACAAVDPEQLGKKATNA